MYAPPMLNTDLGNRSTKRPRVTSSAIPYMALDVFFFSPEVRSVHLQHVQYYAVYQMPHQLPSDDATCRQRASCFNTGAWHARCAILYDLTGASIFLMRDHKRVGEQEVYSMMSRQLFYSFSYLTSVTTGIHP